MTKTVRTAVCGVLIAAGALLVAPGFARSQDDAGDPARGMELAEINCARCHAIGEAGASPMPQALPFRDIMQKYEARMLEEALGEGIVTGHQDMPEFVFSTGEIADLTAYLAQFED